MGSRVCPAGRSPVRSDVRGAGRSDPEAARWRSPRPRDRGTGGFHSFVGFDKKGRRAVVVLHNSAANIDDIGFHLLDAQFPLAASTPPAKPRVAIRVAAATLETYVGAYALAPTFVMTVTREGEQLFLQATGQPRFPIFAETETRFFLKVVDAQLTFVKDASGKAVELILHQNGQEQRAKRQER